MRGLPRRCYTLAFKQCAVEAASQQSIGRTARQFEIPEQTLRNWIESQRQHTLLAVACTVSAEQMDESRRAAVVARHVRLARLISPGARTGLQMTSISVSANAA
jgi:transposase-like protein